MANIPAAPQESGPNAREVLFLTEDDGAGGLRAALFRSAYSQVVEGQRLGSLEIGGVLADTCTNGNVSVASSSTQVLAANANRVFATIVNDSDQVVYLALGATAASGQGIRLNPHGGSFEINQNNLYQGAINAICAGGGANVTVCEGSKG